MEANKKNITGHILAIFTIIVWGTTFISTKVLLADFQPVEILFFRFIIGLILLFAVYPKPLKRTNMHQELLFASAGLCGVTLYYLMENIALTYTLASNVSVILSIAPFFTAIFASRFLDGEKLRLNFVIGFIAAFLGILLISFHGSSILKLNPLGDLLAVSAAVVWALYSILIRKISQYDFHTIQVTQRVFLYGVIFMVPSLFFFPFEWGFERFTQPVNLFNILYLGVGASAICFITWNYALKILGAVKTSVYIYLVPVITIVTSAIVLGERITGIAVLGVALTLAGLMISERKTAIKPLEEKSEESKQENAND